MKILYAANNCYGSKIQLARFLQAMSSTKHNIKIAAYKKSSPKNVNIDWCLNALLNIHKPEVLSLKNDNLSIYFEQIRSYKPDLIISDLEYFTSYIANTLNIRLWQCSSSLINYGIIKNEKRDLGLFKYYAHSLNRDPLHTQRTINLIQGAETNLIYSHYGDFTNPPVLSEKFEWIRPYHRLYKENVLCQHYIVAALYNNKKILNVLKKYRDSVIFTESCLESYPNLLVKDIYNEEEFYCNLRNSEVFVCQGQASFLADAFYNNKYCFIYPDYDDTESITNSQLADKLNVGKIVNYFTDLTEIDILNIKSNYNSIKYLHEKIEEI